MNISISSTFVDLDAYGLVTRILDAVKNGELPDVHVSAVISTRERGDDVRGTTDALLMRLQNDYPKVRLLMHSAKQHGRIKKEPTDEEKNTYDRAILEKLRETPDLHVMVGDMVIKGSGWCRLVPSLNLHPDLPRSMGGSEGMYWDVIGTWVREGRNEVGGMMHLAIPSLDAGTPIAYFRLPTRGVINGVNLTPLWNSLPQNEESRETLIRQQCALKDTPTHPLFRELRRAEAAFEQNLVISAIGAFASGELVVRGGRVFDRQGDPLSTGLDLTREIVGDSAIWPGQESQMTSRREISL